MSETRRVLRILVPMRYPVGGIRTYLKYTHGNLDKNLYAFTFLAPSRKWLHRIKDDFSNYNTKIIHTSREEDNMSMFLALFRAIAKGKYDIIHSQGYSAGIIAIFANLLFRLPHIITLHRIFGKGQFSDSFWDKHTSIKCHVIAFLLSKANIIQCVSNDARGNLLEYFPNLVKQNENLVVIRNGVNITQFEEKPGEHYTHFAKEKDKFYIGFLGRYMPEKGFRCLVKAMEILVNDLGIRDIRVVSIGGFGGFIREYKKEIKDKGLSQYFRFKGFYKNVAPLLRAIDVLAIPSLGEACGLIAMEGLICGTPIVAFSCIGLSEVLRNTPAIMVSVGDIKGMVNALLKVKDDYETTKRKFDDFVPEAKKRFDVTITANGLAKLYEQLIKEKIA